MATVVAVQSGNWSDTSETSPWPGGVKPAVGDTVQTGDYVIEIDEDITVAALEATLTGSFYVNAIAGDGTRTIVANVLNSGTQLFALQVANGTGIVVLTGDVTGGSETGAVGVLVASGGTLDSITGNVTGGSGEAAHGIQNDGSIIGDIIGNVTGGGLLANGVYLASGGTLDSITGNVTGGSGEAAYGLNSDYGLPLCSTITGNVTGGSGKMAYGVFNQSLLAIDVDGVLACGPTGVMPCTGEVRLVRSAANAMTFIDTDDAALTLSNDYPAEADVEDGVLYNRGTMEGTLVAGSVVVTIGGKVTRR